MQLPDVPIQLAFVKILDRWDDAQRRTFTFRGRLSRFRENNTGVLPINSFFRQSLIGILRCFRLNSVNSLTYGSKRNYLFQKSSSISDEMHIRFVIRKFEF